MRLIPFLVLIALLAVFANPAFAQVADLHPSFAAEAQSREVLSSQQVRGGAKQDLAQKFRSVLQEKVLGRFAKPPGGKKDKSGWRSKLRSLAIVSLVLCGLVIGGAILFFAVNYFAISSAAALMGLTLILAMLGALFTAIVAIKALLEGY
ncbi:MAG: hypothetical protein H6581_04300 [Bacteroidia bacterium]|nr:hypothetical protein [Bacteroidia bacterium]